MHAQMWSNQWLLVDVMSCSAVAMATRSMAALGLALLLVACASAPHAKPEIALPEMVALPDPIASNAATTALSLVGTPYRYGGATPAGFDCSGLVYYAYLQAGLQVPRSSELQYLAASPVPLQLAQRGDLLFFKIAGRVSHVAIYLDVDHFVHAPSSGKSVELGSMDSDYYRRHFVGSGRVARD
jgi:murein DD-endopeptidase